MKPYLYSMELHQAFVHLVAHGATYRQAADATGIVSFSTVQRWLERGEQACTRWAELDMDEDARSQDADWEMAQFYQDVTMARGQHLANCARVVTYAAIGRPAEYDENGNQLKAEVVADPRMALEVLARRDRANWARDPVSAQAKADEEEDLETLADRGDALVRELVSRNGSHA